MNSYKYIKEKQINWAKNKGLELIGSKIDKGKKVYTKTIDENLFIPLREETKNELLEGDGGELSSKGNNPARIQALHSSSALCINIFEYWKNQLDLPPLFKSCRLLRANSELQGEIIFEGKFPINHKFQHAPNIDVLFFPVDSKINKIFAIECKFTEPYSSRKHGGIDQKYFIEDKNWENLSEIKQLAERISPDDSYFKYLHAAQLIKHILGLSREYRHSRFSLLYLWYDAFGEDSYKHRQEISEFTEVVRKDGVNFYSITYQELIINLTRYRNEHSEYIKYITDRYL